jgi:hypothetical protein
MQRPIEGPTEINWTLAPIVGALAVIVLSVLGGPVLLTVIDGGPAARDRAVPPVQIVPVVARAQPQALLTQEARPTRTERQALVIARPAVDPAAAPESPHSTARVARPEPAAPALATIKSVAGTRQDPALPRSAGTRQDPALPRSAAGPSFVEFRPVTEARLTALLKDVPEVDLLAKPGDAEKLQKASRRPEDSTVKAEALLEVVARRPDLAGLPILMGKACQISPEAARNLATLGPPLRLLLALGEPRAALGFDDLALIDEAVSKDMALRARRSRGAPVKPPQGADWVRKDAVPTLVQILPVEDKPVRLALVRHLGRIKDADATAGLVRLALFDVSGEVRRAAVSGLQHRPPREYQQLLLDGLRYPWTPVADRAAEALVALGDQDAVAGLADLLDRPDPSGPVRNVKGTWVKPELVRINHLRNCLLCHAPSTDERDVARGLVPTPGERVPEGYHGRSDGSFVRADVTYLRPDFSLKQAVADPEPWPANQRYDYLIRMRALTPAEARRWDHGAKLPEAKTANYPQRQAVLFALRQLTGKDASVAAEGRSKAPGDRARPSP